MTLGGTQRLKHAVEKFNAVSKAAHGVYAYTFDVKDQFSNLEHKMTEKAIRVMVAAAFENAGETSLLVTVRGAKGVQWYTKGIPRVTAVRVTRAKLVRALILSLSHNYVWIAGKLVRQTRGVGMGGRDSPGAAGSDDELPEAVEYCGMEIRVQDKRVTIRQMMQNEKRGPSMVWLHALLTNDHPEKSGPTAACLPLHRRGRACNVASASTSGLPQPSGAVFFGIHLYSRHKWSVVTYIQPPRSAYLRPDTADAKLTQDQEANDLSSTGYHRGPTDTRSSTGSESGEQGVQPLIREFLLPVGSRQNIYYAFRRRPSPLGLTDAATLSAPLATGSISAAWEP
ncbi:hypothetical protein CYMTET_46756 [Cymbomonas tetramitiformis]|uniref:Uncharacterized protein n=1 Tax=Cymbomonas tetramitiformis TaxID=36881 RepID=A0AAE0BVJ4_9CHLO|nr:hypothetical protein CYMTET_46756 [Cymbomonas tetramitiformis]